jgi:hypothetical protein
VCTGFRSTYRHVDVIRAGLDVRHPEDEDAPAVDDS